MRRDEAWQEDLYYMEPERDEDEGWDEWEEEDGDE